MAMSSHSHSSPQYYHAFTEANRNFFDKLASPEHDNDHEHGSIGGGGVGVSKYDFAAWQQNIAQQITHFIQDNLDFINIPSSTLSLSTPQHQPLFDHHHHQQGQEQSHTLDSITLLDYACGTGMISRALAPSVDSIRAIDLSSGMVQRYNELAASSEPSAPASLRTARAVEGDILYDLDNSHHHHHHHHGHAHAHAHHEDADDHADTKTKTNNDDSNNNASGPSIMGPIYQNFSIVAVALAVHHFADPAAAIARLARRLKVGGVLMIVDFATNDDEDTTTTTKGKEEEKEEEKKTWVESGADATIHKHGFSEREMRGMMLLTTTTTTTTKKEEERKGVEGVEGKQGEVQMGEFGWKMFPERFELKLVDDKPTYRRGFLTRATRVA